MWLSLSLFLLSVLYAPTEHNLEQIVITDSQGKKSNPSLEQNEIVSSFDLICQLFDFRLCVFRPILWFSVNRMLGSGDHKTWVKIRNLISWTTFGIIISCPDNELIPSAQCVCTWAALCTTIPSLLAFAFASSLSPMIRQFSKPKIHYSGLDISNCYQFARSCYKCAFIRRFFFLCFYCVRSFAFAISAL